VSLPDATYRLQFRGGMTFERAAGLASYWRELGISHLYASPVFAAQAGSSHGYDVIDFNRFDEALGGEAGFRRLSDALRAAGLGLILDFVPNHMAATPENPWWRDVLERGRESRYAGHFDIDWSAERLLLPVLGRTYDEALAAGELSLSLTPISGRLSLRYFDLVLPLSELSRRLLLDRLDPAAAQAIDNAEAFASPETEQAVERALATLSADHAFLDRLHEAQIWRLAHWHAARDSLTYRRFFEISGLVCLRIEEAEVFDDVHRLLLQLVTEGRVDGIRIDHIDGLAEPRRYLERLRCAVGSGRDVYIVVEKILEADEALPPEWPVAGTTGYEFITILSRLLTTDRQVETLDRAYRAVAGNCIAYEKLVQDTKREILTHNLASELATLTRAAAALASGDPAGRGFASEILRQAIVELICAFPVYRSYVDRDGASAADRSLIATVAAQAKSTGAVADSAAIDFLAARLGLDCADAQRPAALRFALRFQQTTGPVMAKALEDTVFYRYNRLIAVNEVGGDPRGLGGAPETVHARLTRRRREAAKGLSATATHDTKRGEDARARLYSLSEAPGSWVRAVGRWSTMNAGLRTPLDDGPAPESETEWLIYQALLGAWPPTLRPDDRAGLAEFRQGFTTYLEKALREAKRRTRWTAPDLDYEQAVRDFAARLLAPDNRQFLTDFVAACRPFHRAGAINSLAQTLLKLAAPGIPDLYQGCETWDFSLVDPGNRRPVDFERSTSLLAELRQRFDVEAGAADAEPGTLLEDWCDGRIKLFVVARLLRFRRRRGELFRDGAYVPLSVAGARAEHLFAFARVTGPQALVVAVPRHALTLAGDEVPLPLGDLWSNTSIRCPPDFASVQWQDILSGASVTALRAGSGASLAARDILARFPVAALFADGLPAR